jgi:hypothetical protein
MEDKAMEREVVEGDGGGDGWQLAQCRHNNNSHCPSQVLYLHHIYLFLFKAIDVSSSST